MKWRQFGHSTGKIMANNTTQQSITQPFCGLVHIWLSWVELIGLGQNHYRQKNSMKPFIIHHGRHYIIEAAEENSLDDNRCSNNSTDTTKTSSCSLVAWSNKATRKGSREEDAAPIASKTGASEDDYTNPLSWQGQSAESNGRIWGPIRHQAILPIQVTRRVQWNSTEAKIAWQNFPPGYAQLGGILTGKLSVATQCLQVQWYFMLVPTIRSGTVAPSPYHT